MKNVFIVNKSSKTGKAEETWNSIESYLDDNKIEYDVHFTKGASDATRFAKEVTKGDEDITLFVMGGDGTINEALNGIKNFKNTTFVCLPSGSANDFAKGLGLKGDAVEILDRAVKCADAKYIDLGQVCYGDESRIFGVSSGIGVDAYVCLQALDSKLKRFLNHFGLGQATYGLLTIGDLFTMPLSDAQLTFDGKQLDIHNAIFIASMNTCYEGGGIPMVPYAKANSGHLSAVLAHDILRIKCFGIMPFLVAGKHSRFKGIDFIDFNQLDIVMKDKMCVHADGEHVGFFDEITIKCLPKILKIKGL